MYKNERKEKSKILAILYCFIKCLDFESGGAASADQEPWQDADQVHERANAHCREAGELQPGELWRHSGREPAQRRLRALGRVPRGVLEGHPPRMVTVASIQSGIRMPTAKIARKKIPNTKVIPREQGNGATPPPPPLKRAPKAWLDNNNNNMINNIKN